MNEYQVAAM